ncbi:MAG: hypothetical protein ACAH24_07460, partial [Hyphomicrobiaceae bacterium]
MTSAVGVAQSGQHGSTGARVTARVRHYLACNRRADRAPASLRAHNAREKEPNMSTIANTPFLRNALLL